MKEDLKTGMIFKSETHPQFDFVIDFVNYLRCQDDEYGSVICWHLINDEAFKDFVCKKKGYKNMKELLKKTNTFPYAYAGEGMPKSIKARIKKYNMKYIGMSDDEVIVYRDNVDEYSSGFKK